MSPTPPNAPVPDLRSMSAVLRRWVLDASHAAGVGHIGSALSIVDIVSALWGRVLRAAGTDDPDRDRFILSKGHASLALYAAMRYTGRIDADTFATYCRDGSMLGVHPEHTLPGIDLSTGSLGQGLSAGCGLALGLARRRSAGRVFAVLSDAECNEGQVWEAAQFAAHHRLENLTAVIDLNGTQAMGRTADVLDLGDTTLLWRAHGWDTTAADGHDPDALAAVLDAAPAGRPRAVVARTVMGRGVDFMEGQVAWHYRVLSADQYARAAGQAGATDA